jgi:hypothetical protein
MSVEFQQAAHSPKVALKTFHITKYNTLARI